MPKSPPYQSNRQKLNQYYFLMMNHLTLFLLVLVSFLATPAAFAKEISAPKNIILFIGDGMGLSQITAGKIVNGELNLERFKTLGLLTTHSQDSLITDSAASGTAMATGHKTYNGAIAVSQNREPLKTVIEFAEEKQKSTGVVVTSSVTHATPASFIAHVESREKHADIAEQIANSGIDLLFGGGLGYFLPKSTAGSKREDEKDLIAVLGKRMKIVHSVEAFKNLGKVDAVAGFFATEHPAEANIRQPGLAELTRQAIEILATNSNGFFLMVEGSQIDWAGHDNKLNYMIAEIIDFDQAVGVGMDFAEKDAQTLVIVTADHETGGFAIHGGSIDEKKVSIGQFSWKNHTATMVPLFAYGPGSSAFAGISDNTDVGKKLIALINNSTLQPR